MSIDGMTDQEILDLIEQGEQAKAELARRQSREAVRREMGDAIKTARNSGVLDTPESGSEYVAPDDATKLCVKGDIRTHNGQRWVLERGACVGPPSVENGWAKTDPAD